MEKVRSYTGKPYEMNEEDGWHQIDSFIDKKEGNLEWVIFFKRQAHTVNWITLKIVANGRAKNKANYWLVYDILHNSFSMPKDFNLMKKNRPALYEFFMNKMENEYDF